MCEVLYYEQRINTMYVKGVESSSIYTIMGVLLSMSKVSKNSKWSYTSLLLTFLMYLTNFQPLTLPT